MPVSQYVYFALYSRDTSAAEITAILGREPDEIKVRGSRITEPKTIPTHHCWKIVCREPVLRVDEQISRVLERIKPHAEAIAALVHRLDAEDDPGSGAALQVIRYFNDAPDLQDPPDRQDERAETPNLFGWHLDRTVLDFLHKVGAILDIDEYDTSPDYAED